MRRPPSRYSRLSGAYHSRRLWAAAVGSIGLAALSVTWSIGDLWVSAGIGLVVAAHALWRLRRPGTGALDAVLLDATATMALLGMLRPPSAVAVAAMLYIAVPAVVLLDTAKSAWATAYAFLGAVLAPWAGGPPLHRGMADVGLATAALVGGVPMIAWMFGLLRRTLASVGMLREQLSSARSRFEDLFQRSTVPMFRTSPRGRLLDGNRALWDLFGAADFATLVSEPVSLRYGDPADRGLLLDDLAENGRVRGFEVVLRRMDGTEFWGRISASLWGSPDGSVLEGIIEDVSDRRLAERRARLADVVFDQIGAAVVISDTDHRVVEWNRAAERLVGYSRDQALGRRTAEVVASDDPTACIRAREELVATGGWHGEARVIRADGGVVTCLASVTRLTDDRARIQGSVTVLTDITGVREASQPSDR